MKEALFRTICSYFSRRGYQDILPNETEESYVLEGKIQYGRRKRPFIFILPKSEEKLSFYAKIDLGWPVLFKDVKQVFNIVSNCIIDNSLWDLELSESFCVIFVIDPLYKIDRENVYTVLDKLVEDLNRFKLTTDFQKLEDLLISEQPAYSKTK